MLLEEDGDEMEMMDEEEFMGMMMNGMAAIGGFYGANGGGNEDYFPPTTWDLVVKNATPKLPQLDLLLHKY